MTLKKKLILSSFASNLTLLVVFLLLNFLYPNPLPVKTSIDETNPTPTTTTALPSVPTTPTEAPEEAPKLPTRVLEVFLKQPFPSPQIVVEVIDPDGRPVEGARVGWTRRSFSHRDSAVTDEQGQARLPFSKFGYQRGANRLYVSCEAWAPAILWVSHDEDFRRVILEPGINFSGRVVDQFGNPVTNAAIQIMHGEEDVLGRAWRDEQADSNGFFSFSALSQDGFGIIVDAPGFILVEREMVAEEASRGTVEFRLVPEREISVVVLDREGLPINGAWIKATAFSSEGRRTRESAFTRKEGRAIIRGVSLDISKIFLVVTAGGYDNLHRRVLVEGSESVDLTVQFTESYDDSKTSTFVGCGTGLLYGIDPASVEDLSNGTWNPSTNLPNILEELTEKSHEESSEPGEKSPTPRSAAKPSTPELRTPPEYATVVGHLVDANGRPLEVNARGPGWYVRHANGYFEIRARANEPTKIVAVWEWPRHVDRDQPVEPIELTSEPLLLAPDERRELVFRIPEIAPVTVNVSDLHGEPVAGAFVTIVHNSHSVWSEVPTSVHGAVVALLPSGEYTFKVSMCQKSAVGQPFPDIQENPKGLTVATHVVQSGSETQEVELVVDRGNGIFGRLVDSSGQPVPYRKISVKGHDPFQASPLTAVSDSTGAFELDGLVKGPYRILVEGPRGRDDGLDVQGVRLDDSPLTLVVPRTTLSVLVVDEDTGEILSAALRLSLPSGPTITGRTDAQGRCVFHGIGPGNWELEVVLEDSLKYSFNIITEGNSEIRLPVARGAFVRFESLPVELLSDNVLSISVLEDDRKGALWREHPSYRSFNSKAWESESPIFGPLPGGQTIVTVLVSPDHGFHSVQSETESFEAISRRSIKLRLDPGQVTTVDWNDSRWMER